MVELAEESNISSLWSSLKESLFPPLCELCGKGAKSFVSLCDACQHGVLPLPKSHCLCCAQPFISQETRAHLCSVCLKEKPSFTKVFSPFLMEGSIQRLLHQVKFGSQISTVQVLAQLAAPSFKKAVQEFLPDLLLPVPLSRLRLLRRSFNQSVLLSKELLSASSLDLDLDFSIGRRYQRPQAQKKRADRLKALGGAFSFRKPKSFEGLKILIVDDVLTTGATAEALTRLCLKARAREVGVWVLARRA
ncbi:MAG: ComF family protein [Deltaproteobacteria bacterium]|nr:ComF family protein [Deltaproteobacteria bacterium]